MKKAIVSVINDLSTDQRVHRTCMTLHNLGFKVLLVGRDQRSSMPFVKREYETYRIKLFFEKGFCFYAAYNLRLFFFLLFSKADVLVANDLDTLLPNYLVSKMKRTKLVYDTHEIFCEVPELQKSRWKKNFWKRIEKFCFPKLKYVFTVNESIAKIYSKEYKVEINIVRNIPDYKQNETLKTREELGLPTDKKIILLQGAGINIQRGAEEAVQAMQYVENAILLIIGGGDVIDFLKKITEELYLSSKIIFIPKLPFNELMQYTRIADIGLTLDKDTNINYRYSLPNKIFDYIHAGLPVLASDLYEVKKVVENYEVGLITANHEPKHIAEKILSMINDESKMKVWRENCKLASSKLTWKNEEQELIKVFSQFV